MMLAAFFVHYAASQSGVYLTVASAVDQKTTELNTLSSEELQTGWLSLFDGKTLYGWRAENQANWTVNDGVISVDEGDAGLLRTSAQFDNFKLRVDFRSAKGTNSGIFVRTSPKPAKPASDCYEINIAAADNAFPTGSLAFRKKVEGEYQSDDWQTYEITALNALITVELDGKKILEYRDKSPLGRGYIGLQLNKGKVEFRNIFIQPLELKSLFNGKDLSGWKEYPEMETDFSVVEGDLHVEGGRGQLETKDSYGDFIMQLQCRTNALKLNSGIFFRCIPGETMNGYESQIHNGFKDDDKTKPEDHGTGGIFRRQQARFVVANDLEWFTKTIIAEGPHICTWVNGIQVADFTDKRKPDDNPRRGYRKEAGTIMIQGHDPTTDIDFRAMKIREMKSRR